MDMYRDAINNQWDLRKELFDDLIVQFAFNDDIKALADLHRYTAKKHTDNEIDLCREMYRAGMKAMNELIIQKLRQWQLETIDRIEEE